MEISVLRFVAVAALAASASVASADIVNAYSFAAFTNNSTAASRAAVGSQLQVTVAAPSTSSTFADFTFRNFVGTPSNVAEIYFDGGSFLSGLAITRSIGTDFQTAPGRITRPGELPSGNNIQFDTSSVNGNKTSLDSNNGLNAIGDLLTVRINFTGKTVAELLTSMASPTNTAWFRIGLHVRSINGNNSDSFINAAPPALPVMVPLPAAVWPGLAMLGGAFGINALRRRANKI